MIEINKKIKTMRETKSQKRTTKNVGINFTTDHSRKAGSLSWKIYFY